MRAASRDRQRCHASIGASMNVRDVPLLPTTVVGSHPQPDWLIDRLAAAKGVPRVRASNLWRVAPEHLERGARRSHVGCHPRHGTRRNRHHQRRRDSSRELFEPLCLVARRRRGRERRNDHEQGGSGGRVPRLSARFAVQGRLRSADSESCARQPTERSRSRCPARSP